MKLSMEEKTTQESSKDAFKTINKMNLLFDKLLARFKTKKAGSTRVLRKYKVIDSRGL